MLTATVMEHDPIRHLTRLQAGSVSLWVLLQERELGSQMRVRIPAREVILAPVEPGPTSVHNVISARVRAITPDEAKNLALVEIAMPDQVALLARVTLDFVEHLALKVGRPVVALIKSVSIEILPG